MNEEYKPAKIEFRKSLAMQKMVRLFVEDAEFVEKIAKENDIEQTEVIRTLVHSGIEEYKRQLLSTNNK